MNPVNSGIVPRVMQFGFCGVNALYLMTCFKRWQINVKTVGFFGALVVAEKALLEMPNYINESIQMTKRRGLAR